MERWPTSPSNLRILKLRLLILSDGEPGKQFRQFPKEVMRSRNTCAMATNGPAQCLKLGPWTARGRYRQLARWARRVIHDHLSSGVTLQGETMWRVFQRCSSGMQGNAKSFTDRAASIDLIGVIPTERSTRCHLQLKK